MNDLPFGEELVLLAVVVGDPNGSLVSKIRDSLEPTNAQVNIASVLPQLQQGGFVEKLPLLSRQRSARWQATSEGKKCIAERLGAMPARMRGALPKAARLLAINRVFQVAPRVAEALADDENLLAAYFLATQLGCEYHVGATAVSLARDVAGAALGLSGAKGGKLWEGVIAKALAAGSKQESASETAAPADDFASSVLRAAHTARTGWLGPGKLFIHRAWEAWRAAGGDAELEAFKQRLLDELRAGRIALLRADFTAGLDPDELQQAETKYGDETFHCLSTI